MKRYATSPARVGGTVRGGRRAHAASGTTTGNKKIAIRRAAFMAVTPSRRSGILLPKEER
jgi:hypothetical protein